MSNTEDLENETENSIEHGEEEEGDFASAPRPKQVTITDEELRALQHELLEYKDKYLRILADQENSRKRAQKESVEQLRFANEALIIEFIQPIDNLENALNFAKEMSDEVKNWAIGFQMILTQFKDVLQQHGVTAFESLGLPFDPHFHEAVEMIVMKDHPAGIIVKEYVRGYKMGDKTIRPARVQVSKTDNEEISS